MKIEKIRVYQVDLPVNEGSYNFADGKAVSVFDSTVVEIITDSGIKGYGEVCVLPLALLFLPTPAPFPCSLPLLPAPCSLFFNFDGQLCRCLIVRWWKS